jgi:multiple sugar transport system permease protein
MILIEAARMDGLNELSIWWKIAMPLVNWRCRRWRSFWQLDRAFLAADFDHVQFTRCLSAQPALLSNRRSSGKWIATGAAIATIPTLVVFLVLQRYIVRGRHASGLKG